MIKKPKLRSPGTRRRFTIAVVMTMALLPGSAIAFNFKPTVMEWAMWPEHCRARYASLQVGKQLPYVATYPPTMITTWKARIGDETFVHLHHYCASLAYMQRASLAVSKQERNHLLKSAEGECRYTLSRIPSNGPLYREVAGHMQMVQSVRGAAY